MKIGLLWHSLVSGNMGVRALTVANMAIIDAVAREEGIVPEFVILGVGEKHEVTVEPVSPSFFAFTTRSLFSPQGYYRQLDELDVIIDIGAGDSFADIYGPRRFAFLWLSKALAIWRGVPVLMAPQTIGPFDKPIYRALAAWAMNRCAAVVARDRSSLAAIERIAPRARAAVAVDVAFRLPFEDRGAERGGRMRRIGVNVSGLLFHEAETRRNRFGLSYDYAQYSRALLADLTARDDLEVYLVPHATSTGDPSDDDGQIADRMAAEFPRAVRVGDFGSASAAKSFISGLDFLVAARMHACIGAFSAGVPVLPVAYSRKFSGLFDMVEYPHVLPVTGLNTEQALAATLDGLDSANTMQRDVDRGLAKVEQLLAVYRAELKSLFASVMRKTSR